ncbi:tRNA-specific adenosine deaminase 2 [Zeugodacus cucurbitae]|uniref:tRNA-specific adenosine deaminase 2 n=1 Tax=Zeugodacus cucurbitae TaxID=28588 RepID=UPI0023D8F750|nr:tRNA-specific adenosine deaminase 2 [Zeugodacus cucurbitae]
MLGCEQSNKLIVNKKLMEQFMSEAFLEAKSVLEAGEVPVGCIFLYHDNEKIEVIARSGNNVNATKNATRHAEFLCIDKTLEFCKQNGLCHYDVFRKISVIVTVEPCIMCSAALHDLGVREILYGCANDRFGGKTLVDVPFVTNKTDGETKVNGGVYADEAMSLLKEFYKGHNPSAPLIKTKR